MVKGRAQLSEVNRESKRFPQLPPLAFSSSVLLLGRALHPGLCSGLWAKSDKSSQNESFNCEEPSSAGGVAQNTISHPGSKVFFKEKVTSQQPGLFLTKFYCKFLLKDILIIYKL